MQPWLLIVGGQLIALALYVAAPRFWIKRDVDEFNLNGGTKDDNHGTFHRQRFLWRVAFDVVVALVCSLPWLFEACQKLVKLEKFLTSSIGLASIGAAYFFYAFNPGLSLSRGLDYVQQYYVSFDPAASWWPDRFLANRAKRAVAWPNRMLNYDEAHAIDTNRRAHAARELQVLLRLALWAGIGVYVIGLVLAYWLV